MITVNCSSPTTIKLSDLTPFQDDLKKRDQVDILNLAKSLSDEGMMMPFAIWQHNGKNFILDGHGRLAALTELALQDNDILSQDFPCIVIAAPTEIVARQALLQITSSYGKITKKGAIKFCATIPEYHAPAINRFVHKPKKKRVTEENKNNETVVRVAVQSDKAEEFLNILKGVSYVRIL